jgi:hypothetical protein
LNFQKYDEFNLARYRNLNRRRADSYSIDSILSQSINLAYGLTDDLDLLAVFPFQSFHKLNSTLDGRRFEDGDDAGIGDFMFLAKYRFYKSPSRAAALILGIEIPSGNNSQDGNNSSQIGSGSWDPIMGLAFSQAFKSFNFDTSLLYLLSTPGSNDITVGDNISFNAGLSKKILSNKILGQDIDWTLITEMNGQWREKVSFDGKKDPNQGGLIIYATGGLRFTLNEKLSNSFYLSLPLLQDLSGNQSDVSYQVGFNTSLVF